MRKFLRVIIIYIVYVILIAFIGLLSNFLFRRFNWDYDLFRPSVFVIATIITTSIIIWYLNLKKLIVLDLGVNQKSKKVLGVIILGLLALVIRHFLFGFGHDQKICISSYDIINKLLPTLVVAPFCEELFFRNVIQKMLSDCINIHFAVLCASVIFAFEHVFSNSFSDIYFLFHLVGGLIYGYSYFYSGSILVAISIHFLFNLSTFIIPLL